VYSVITPKNIISKLTVDCYDNYDVYIITTAKFFSTQCSTEQIYNTQLGNCIPYNPYLPVLQNQNKIDQTDLWKGMSANFTLRSYCPMWNWTGRRQSPLSDESQLIESAKDNVDKLNRMYSKLLPMERLTQK